MAKSIQALEISSSSVKLVVGYVLDKDVVVLYASMKKLPLNAIVGEEIKDPDTVALAIAELLKDGSNRLKSDIKDVVLVLPPIGFEVFENTQATNIVSSTGIIADVDIRNVISMLKKDRYDQNNKIVDIIPQNYYLDQNRIFANSPIGESSSTLQMHAFIHTISADVSVNFTQLVKRLGVNVTKCVVSSYAYSSLFKDYHKMPEKYILVDVGAEYTTVSTIGNGLPYGSSFFPNGSEKLSQAIQNDFKITRDEALHLKEVFGLDESISTYHPTIMKSEDELGNEISYTIEDLNHIVSQYLNEFVKDLKRSLKTILEDESVAKAIPLVIVGGGSKLNGFKEFIEAQQISESIIFPALRSLGARDIEFAPSLGAIKVGENEAFSEDKDTTRIATPLTREKKKLKYSETEDKL